MPDFCTEHSGMVEKIKTNADDIAKIETANKEQWERLDEHSLYSKDWPKITKHGEAIASMKRDLRIIMVIGILILTAVIKLAFWPA